MRQRNRTTFTLFIEGGETEERGDMSERERNRERGNKCACKGTHVEFQNMTYSSQFFPYSMLVPIMRLEFSGLVATTLSQSPVFLFSLPAFLYLGNLLLEQTFINSSNICPLFSSCNR